jgi:DNA primase
MTEYSLFDAPASSLVGVDLDVELLDAVAAHWHETFIHDPRRDDVARTLGLTVDHATALGVGISDRSLGLRIPSREVKAGRLLRERLEALGVLRASGHEAFRGCVVVPVRQVDRIVALFARRLDDPSRVLWASGLEGGVFEQRVESLPPGEPSRTNCLITTSIPDALAVIGALRGSSGQVGSAFKNETTAVLGPARPKGYGVKDLRAIAQRDEQLFVLGRGSDELVERLRALEASVTLVGSDLNVARTLLASKEPGAVVAQLLDVERRRDEGQLAVALAEPTIVYGDKATNVGAKLMAEPVVKDETAAPVASPSVTTTPGRDETFVRVSARTWRLRGARARANVEGDRLAVALSVNAEESGRFHLDTLDLYSARQRSAFLDAAERELRVERATLLADMIHVLHAGEVARDEPNEDNAEVVSMTDVERREALAWLAGPDLLARLRTDLSQLGVVGEATNLLVCYLAVLSRKTERPLGVLVQSSSAGGKSTLVEAVNSLVPPEDLVSLSAITSQALYYLGGTGLRHKVLFVAEEHGSSRAAYALKLLVSEGRLSIASTGKDAASGQLRTKNYETLGPLSLMMTTTSTTLDPELENRLVVLGVDEDPAQTQAIIAAQRASATLEGFSARAERERQRQRHHHIQRLLDPVAVVVPDVSLVFPSSATRHRRDHAKLLSLITALALLHQHQRERRTEMIDGVPFTYVEARPEDVDVASELCRRVLVRDAEALAPQARRLLAAVRTYAGEEASRGACEAAEIDVTRRQLRELLGWSDTQVRAATERLVALEYLVVSGGGRGRCRTYRLVPDFAPLPRRDSDDGGEVRGDDARTSQPPSPGKEGEFVRFVPFGQLHETGDSYTEGSYDEVVDVELEMLSAADGGER